jgi:cytochrome c biogenesis protein CcmG/thiol:disulfide interchange protein DsbE
VSAAWLPRGIGRVGFAALALAAGLLIWQRAGDRPSPQPTPRDPLLGRTLILSATAPLPGRTEPPTAQHPAGPHLVNLFASWCIPCRVEAPVLAALAAQGIWIDGIAVRDEAGAVSRFLKREGDPFVRVRLDQRGQVQAALGVAGLPETYVVDATGTIIFHHRGPLEPGDVAVLGGKLR